MALPGICASNDVMEQRDFRLNLCPPPPPLSSLPFCLVEAPNALSLLKHFSNGWPNTKPPLALLVLPFRPSLLILLESKKLVVNAFRFSKSGARRFWLFCCKPSVVAASDVRKFERAWIQCKGKIKVKEKQSRKKLLNTHTRNLT